MYRRFQPNSLWNEMDRLQREMNLLSSMFSPRQQATVQTFPAINLWSNEESAVATVEIPGVKIEDLEIMITGDTLTLKGSRDPDTLTADAVRHRQERGCGQFMRSLKLPFPVESEKVDATLKNGVLQVHLPRASADKPRKITVNTQS
jgi:HSP20 family protein